MAYPKIVYVPSGTPVTLQFTYPPVQQEGVPRMVACRVDNLSTDGHRQSALRRVDQFLSIDMRYALLATDIVAWQTFMTWAMGGGSFQYYPDSSQAAFTNYVIESTDWTPAYNSPQRYNFKFDMRKVIA